MKNLNTLNNKLKHRGGCYLKNFNGNYLINDIKLHYFNLSEIDIDEDYDLLITAHNNIVKCYDYFLNQINNELNLLFKRNDIK